MGLDVNNERQNIGTGNSYLFPMDNNPFFSLSLFLPINREGSGHKNASAGIEQSVRGRKIKCSAGNSFHVGVFVPVRRRPWNPSLYRAGAFTSRSNGTVRDSLVNRLPQGMAFRVWTRGEIFLLHRYKTFVADLKRSDPVGVSGRFSFFTRCLVAFPKVT